MVSESFKDRQEVSPMACPASDNNGHCKDDQEAGLCLIDKHGEPSHKLNGPASHFTSKRDSDLVLLLSGGKTAS